MTHFNQIESAILQRLARRGPCTIDELTQRLPDYSWNQVFTSLDRLSRERFLTLRRPSTFQYVVSLNAQTAADSDVTGVAQ
jgi:predicted transcriptional regulator